MSDANTNNIPFHSVQSFLLGLLIVTQGSLLFASSVSTASLRSPRVAQSLAPYFEIPANASTLAASSFSLLRMSAVGCVDFISDVVRVPFPGLPSS